MCVWVPIFYKTSKISTIYFKKYPAMFFRRFTTPIENNLKQRHLFVYVHAYQNHKPPKKRSFNNDGLEKEKENKKRLFRGFILTEYAKSVYSIE